MKGRSTFTRLEADQIIGLIRQKLKADSSAQKGIRNKIRQLGFYASDFGLSGGYTEHDFLRVVKITGEAPAFKAASVIKDQTKSDPISNVRGALNKFSFPPISNFDARILILGTMPGERSIALNQYYGHGGNQFWKIIFGCFDEPFSDDYEIKKQLLLENKIALWDVLQNCEREGSADNSIKAESPNDFVSFFNEHPEIKTIIFNGKNAWQYFENHVGFDEGKEYQTLPSTSPANTWATKEEKSKLWKDVVLSRLQTS